MKLDKLDKLVKQAREKKLTPGEFGQMLCSPPHNLTPPEATPLMQGYARSFTSAVARVALKPLPQRPAAAPVVTDAPAPGSLSIINRSAVKQYALKVSKEKRAGKFTRVGAEFLDGVQASLESKIRGLPQSTDNDDVTPDPEADWFVNGRTTRMAEEQLNAAVRAIIWLRVQRHPSIGCTLK